MNGEKDLINNKNSYNQRIQRVAKQGEFARLFYIAKKSLPGILGIVGLSILTAFLINRWTSPTYESTAIIQIEQDDQAKDILNVEQMFKEDDLIGEIEFLKSPLLVKKTIEKLPIDIRYYTQGNLLTHEKYPTPGFRVDSIQVKNIAVTNQKIFFTKKSEAQYSLTIEDVKYDNLTFGKLEQLPPFDLIINTKNHLSDNDEMYFKIQSTDQLVDEFINSLNVFALNSRAKSVAISMKAQNPKLASDFVNTHVATYLDYGIERQNESARNILMFIENQLDTVSKNLQDAERLLSSFRSKNKVNTDIGSSNLFNTLTEFDNESVEIEFQENILNELETLTRKNNDEIDVYQLMALLVGTRYESVLKDMLDELSILLKSKEELDYQVTQENERIKAIDHQIEIQKGLIRESISSLRDKLVNRKRLVDTKRKNIEEQFVSIPSKELELARYQRLFNISEKYYNLLLEKRTLYNISKAGRSTKNKILSAARTNDTPVSPNKKMIFVGLFIFGLIVSALYTMLRYLRFDRIISFNDIINQSDASLNALGIVPKVVADSKAPQLLIKPNDKTLLAESLRSIKSNLRFVSSEDHYKTVAITSTISAEGKSFISINLAAVHALSGKKVLLLDFDLRKPKLHLAFNLDNDKGVSSILKGSHSFDDCVQNTALENLHVITSGPIPENPHELTQNGELSSLINELKEHYDYLAIDTSPIGLVNDGFSILQCVDLPIYVFKSEVSKRSFILNADRLVHENNLNKLSVILNAVDYRQTHYGSSMGYGYGYVKLDKSSSAYYNDLAGQKRSWLQKILGR